MKTYKRTEGQRKRISEGTKLAMARPDVRKKYLENYKKAMLDYKPSKDTLEKRSKSMKGKNTKPKIERQNGNLKLKDKVRQKEIEKIYPDFRFLRFKDIEINEVLKIALKRQGSKK